MDAASNIVEDESLAVGHPVTVDINNPEKCFCFDKTGDNTDRKSDGRRGGKKFVVAKGQAAKNVLGTNNTYFTVILIINLNGRMVMLVMIFAAKKLPKSWFLGIDVFVDFDEDNYGNNFGIGRRYPGLQLYCGDGTIIPICWAASPNACMLGEILTLVFRQMDKLGITKAGSPNMVCQSLLWSFSMVSLHKWIPNSSLISTKSQANGWLCLELCMACQNGNCMMMQHKMKHSNQH
jgi:hypothetical protein